MPLSACWEERDVVAPLLEEDKWAELKLLTRAQKVSLIVPCCNTPARLRTGVNGLKHFYQAAGTGCETAGKTVEHLLAKAIVLQSCRAAGYTAVTEWAENDWR